MRNLFMIGATVASLAFCGGAAAFDETRDDFVAPGLHFTVSFGGSQAMRVDSPPLREQPLALAEAGSDTSTRTTLIVLGVVAGIIIVVAASHHGGGGGSGGGY